MPEFLQRQGLRTTDGVDVGDSKDLANVGAPGLGKRLEGIAERLAPLGEHGSDHCGEEVFISESDGRLAESPVDHSRTDLRRRSKRSRRQGEQSPDVGVQLNEHARTP